MSTKSSFSVPITTAYPAPPSGLLVHDAINNHGDAIREGAWETGLFCCLDTNFAALLNAFMGWCLPCVTIAQVSHRLGTVNYWAMLLLLLVLYAGERVVNHYSRWDRRETSYLSLLADYSINKAYTSITSDELHPENIYLLYTTLGIHFGCGLWAFVGIVPGIAMAIATWVLRSQTRSRFRVPGSLCLDGVVALFCSCCGVAQLAVHLRIPKRRACNIGPVDTLSAFQ